jgi:ribosomal protein S18 acetylase RimI-like enzyme
MVDLAKDLKIRKLCGEDYDALTALWQKCGLPFKPRGRDSREKIARELTKETAIFLAAELDGQMVGSVLGTHDGRKGWINRLAVDPGFQHRGIAQRLLLEAENALYQLGIEIIACLIEDYNHTSMAFFQKAGYTRHNDIFYFTRRKHPDV